MKVYADDAYWLMLIEANTHYTLPPHEEPLTVEAMKKWLERFGMSMKQHREMVDPENRCKTQSNRNVLEDFIAMNPTWNLRPWVGVLAESVFPAIPN